MLPTYVPFSVRDQPPALFFQINVEKDETVREPPIAKDNSYLPAPPRPRANQFPVGDFSESVKSPEPDGGNDAGVQPEAASLVDKVIPDVIVKVEPSLFFNVPTILAAEYFSTYELSTAVSSVV